jgi:ATP-dependent RNA helicase DDX24/MAK5
LCRDSEGNFNAEEDDAVFKSATRAVDTAPVREDIQTFVFSATLSKDLQSNLNRGGRRPGKKGKDRGTTLDDLMDKLDFRDEHPEVIDLSPQGGLVASLRECIVECVITEKVSIRVWV